MSLYKIFRPIIFCLDPELAHNLAIYFLKKRISVRGIAKNDIDPILEQTLCGIKFNNPVGLAAGFDKNADLTKSIYNFGFGFAEFGTITPRPQSGNPKPRIFRDVKNKAILNSLGFNNKGIDFLEKKLSGIKKENSVFGINIGKNKDSEGIEDYLYLLERVYNRPHYITINISSPNTKNLRDLQNKDQLDELLFLIKEKKSDLMKKYDKDVPIFLKVSPDLNENQCEDISKKIIEHSVDGLLISNSTIEKKDVSKKLKNKNGGVTGKPLFEQSNKILEDLYYLTKGKVPIIGCGGVFSAEDAYKKIRLGASLVQLYTAIIYEGFGIVKKINDGLSELLKKDGFQNIKEAIGADNNI